MNETGMGGRRLRIQKREKKERKGRKGRKSGPAGLEGPFFFDIYFSLFLMRPFLCGLSVCIKCPCGSDWTSIFELWTWSIRTVCQGRTQRRTGANKISPLLPLCFFLRASPSVVQAQSSFRTFSLLGLADRSLVIVLDFLAHMSHRPACLDRAQEHS